MPTVPRDSLTVRFRLPLPSPPHYSFPNLIGPNVPPDFKLWPDPLSLTAGLPAGAAGPGTIVPAAISLPVTPVIPPAVASGDLITANHENMVRQALNDLWVDIQALGTAAINDPTTAKGQIVVRGASAIEAMPAGANGQVLVADSTQAQGLRWANSGTLQTPWLQHIDGGGFNLSNAGQITTTGRLGVGFSFPNAPLDVRDGNDNLAVYQPASNTMAIQVYLDGQWANRASYAPSNNLLLLQPDAGRVGIGLTAPVCPLSVRSPGTDGLAAIFGNASGAVGVGLVSGSIPYIQGYSSDSAVGGQNLCLQPSGPNVGICTTTPTAPLHVNQQAAPAATGQIILRLQTLYSAVVGSGGVIEFTDAATRICSIHSTTEAGGAVGLAFGTFNSGWAERVRISASGNVGIGTKSPAYPLHVCVAATKAVVVQDPAIGSVPGILATGMLFNAVNATASANIPMGFYATAFTFAGGDVGIGTTTIGARLHVYDPTSQRVTAILAQGTFDPGFQLIAQNGANVNGLVEQARFGLSYGSTWNAGIRFFRGGGASDGSLKVDAGTLQKMDIGPSTVDVYADPDAKLRVVSGGAGIVLIDTHNGPSSANQSLVLHASPTLSLSAAGVKIAINSGGVIQMWLGGSLKTLSVDGSGFVKAA